MRHWSTSDWLPGGGGRGRRIAFRAIVNENSQRLIKTNRQSLLLLHLSGQWWHIARIIAGVRSWNTIFNRSISNPENPWSCKHSMLPLSHDLFFYMLVFRTAYCTSESEDFQMFSDTVTFLAHRQHILWQSIVLRLRDGLPNFVTVLSDNFLDSQNIKLLWECHKTNIKRSHRII